jgi:hypothetical protein
MIANQKLIGKLPHNNLADPALTSRRYFTTMVYRGCLQCQDPGFICACDGPPCYNCSRRGLERQCRYNANLYLSERPAGFEATELQSQYRAGGIEYLIDNSGSNSASAKRKRNANEKRRSRAKLQQEGRDSQEPTSSAKAEGSLPSNGNT